eukprot:s1490_g3.t1
MAGADGTRRCTDRRIFQGGEPSSRTGRAPISHLVRAIAFAHHPVQQWLICNTIQNGGTPCSYRFRGERAFLLQPGKLQVRPGPKAGARDATPGDAGEAIRAFPRRRPRPRGAHSGENGRLPSRWGAVSGVLRVLLLRRSRAGKCASVHLSALSALQRLCLCLLALGRMAQYACIDRLSQLWRSTTYAIRAASNSQPITDRLH